MGQFRPLFFYFRSFQTQIVHKIVGFSGIWTRIVGLEGEHADHLITTTAQFFIFIFNKIAMIMKKGKKKTGMARFRPVWPDLAKFHHFGNNLQVFVKFLMVYFLFGKTVNLLWEIYFTSGLIFIVKNGQILIII